MRSSPRRPSPARATPAVVLAFCSLLAACGSRTAAEPGSREIPWTYGPTTGGATAEHVQGTGGKGGKAVAKGWQLRLRETKRLTIVPYQLAEDHALFGKVALSIGLFDKSDQQIGTVTTGTLTAKEASASFDLAADVAAKLYSVVLWYVKA